MILVIGLGKTGLSIARYLQRQQMDFCITDTRDYPPQLTQFAQQFASDLYLPWQQVTLSSIDQIVVSPGVSLQLPLLQQAQQQGIEILGDIELFVRATDVPIAAITGTNGKGSVTTLLQQMATTAGLNARLGGNIGVPVLDLLTQAPADLYVLELSSFQLQTTHSLAAKVACILNISPDHLDQHQDMAEYIAAKQRIYRNAEYCVVNADDALTATDNAQWQFSLHAPVDEQSCGLRDDDLYQGNNLICSVADLRVKGQHNVSNVLAAVAMGTALALPLESMAAAAKAFTGLAHRCQLIHQAQGVSWYDDSKATNMGACQAAIRGLSPLKQLILLAGGNAKGQDLSYLCDDLRGLKQVILFGKDAATFGQAIARHYHQVDNLAQAVELAKQLAQTGDIVLLSPACSSLDQFNNFAERGDLFQQLVKM